MKNQIKITKRNMYVSFFIHNELETSQIEEAVNNYIKSENGKKITEVLSLNFTSGDKIVEKICKTNGIDFAPVLELRVGSLKDKNLKNSDKASLYKHCSNELISMSDSIITIYPKSLKDKVHVIEESLKMKIECISIWI